jgi:hypothetical protein
LIYVVHCKTGFIHKLEVGAGHKILRAMRWWLAVRGADDLFMICAYRNFATPEAMDSAQLARNISEGKGYTTLFIRPFSLYLVQSHNQNHNRANYAPQPQAQILILRVSNGSSGSGQSAGVSGCAGGIDEGAAVSITIVDFKKPFWT